MTSMRTTRQLSEIAEGIKQSSGFNASWDRAKKKSLQEIYNKVTPREANSLPVDPYFLDRNNSREIQKIDYEKFKAKRWHHRARHNLTVAHDFFPVFYKNLKKEFNTTIEGAVAATAASSELQSIAQSKENDARRYARQTREAQQAAKTAAFDAQDARKEADDAIDRTRQERKSQEEQTVRLSEVVRDTHIRNVELTDENEELKRKLTAMERQQLVLNEENARQLEQNRKHAAENRRIRERAQSARNPAVGLLNIGSGAASDTPSDLSDVSDTTTSQKTNAVGAAPRLKRWVKKAFKRGGRKRTKKKCSKRRLKKKMLCVRGTKRRLKKLKKHTKRLKLKLTRCSKQRLKKNFTVRKKRKYTRRK